MYKADLREMKRLTAVLEDMSKRALPHAVRNSLNSSAFTGRRQWQAEITHSFVLRNKYTARSVRVVKAKGVRLSRMEARLGSVAPYMDRQEKGGTIRSKSKYKPIPTSAAAGQRGAVPRTKTVRRVNYMSKISLATVRGRSRKQRNAIAIDKARRGTKYALLEKEDGGQAIVKVTGKARKRRKSRRKRTRSKAKGSKGNRSIRMIYDLSQGSVKVGREPTLQRTLNKIHPAMVRHHVDSLKEQIARAASVLRRS